MFYKHFSSFLWKIYIKKKKKIRISSAVVLISTILYLRVSVHLFGLCDMIKRDQVIIETELVNLLSPFSGKCQ